ncbi:MAG: hypothetical protein KFH98_03295 [Gemmatimonadetes bacterium]|nr:hypothetical protein [Gemmatimonadota bacterium]
MDNTTQGMMLFTERSLWTMAHGIVLGGGALLALAAALFTLYLLRPAHGQATLTVAHARAIALLTVVIAAATWLTTLIGTYAVFPPYRAAPPEGAVTLALYPRSLILSNPQTAWLHSFAMETKEHLPWIAAMLATAAAFTAWRHRATLLHDVDLRRIVVSILAICFVIVAYVSLLGVFVNKVAPLE